MIKVENLSKSYGPIQALDNVSFEVNAGEIVGLLGPNGAGKTTMIKILTGYLQPDEGQVTINGLDVMIETLAVQANIGYLPENAPLYPQLSVQTYLSMMAELRLIPREDQLAAFARTARATGLLEHLTRPISQLSKGFRQRVGLAQAILHNPRLLVLDEPTVGLDPTQRIQLRSLVKQLAEQSTVLLSTHILSEVEAVCDRVIILMNGKIKADARLADLAATSDIVLELGSGNQDIVTELDALPKVLSVKAEETAEKRQYWIQTESGADLRPAVYDLARRHKWPLCELRRDIRTLEMVFNELALSEENSIEEGIGA